MQKMLISASVILLLSMCMYLWVKNKNEFYEPRGYISAKLSPDILNLEDNVSLVLLKKSQKQAILSLNNNNNVPIFVSYSGLPETPDFLYIPYGLYCTTINGRGGEYSPELDSLPSREKINGDTSVKFKVDLPNINGTCSLRIRYFDDTSAIVLHEKVYNENFQGYTSEEESMLKKKRKFASLNFRVQKH